MTEETLSPVEARRLAISAQHRAEPRLRANAEGLWAVLKSLRYLQLDPVSIVAPSHELVLWSRVGRGGASLVQDCLWRQRSLFEYWVYSAAIVLTEDYPMYRTFMDAYPPCAEIRDWMAMNHRLRDYILDRLGAGGLWLTGTFDDLAVVPWQASGWTAGRNVERILQFLWLSGAIMVAGRDRGERLWARTEGFLAPEVDRRRIRYGLLGQRARKRYQTVFFPFSCGDLTLRMR